MSVSYTVLITLYQETPNLVLRGEVTLTEKFRYHHHFQGTSDPED